MLVHTTIRKLLAVKALAPKRNGDDCFDTHFLIESQSETARAIVLRKAYIVIIGLGEADEGAWLGAVPFDALKQLPTGKKAHDWPVTLMADNDNISIIHVDGEARYHLADASVFPAWKRFIPKHIQERPRHAQLAPEYLMRAERAAQLLGDTFIHVWPRGPEEPAIVVPAERPQDMLMLLMPRIGGDLKREDLLAAIQERR